MSLKISPFTYLFLDLQDAHLYLDILIPPVLLLLKDPESRVRYYACEALYNFTKVLRGHVLVFFNEIFVGLCSVRLCVSIRNVARDTVPFT